MSDEEQIPVERVEFFALTVGALWRESRVSCPHRDILRAHHDNALESAQADYVTFHVEEAACPFCQAVLEDIAREDADAKSEHLETMRERLVSSTISMLREKRKRDSR